MIKFAPNVFQEILSLLKPSFPESSNKNPYGRAILMERENGLLTFRVNNYLVESKVFIPPTFEGIECDVDFKVVVDSLIYKSMWKGEVCLSINDNTLIVDSGDKHLEVAILDPDGFRPEVPKPDSDQYLIVQDKQWIIESFGTAKSAIPSGLLQDDPLLAYNITDGHLMSSDKRIAYLIKTENIGESRPDAKLLNPIVDVIKRTKDGEVFVHFSPKICSIMVSSDVDSWYTFTPIENPYPKLKEIIETIENTKVDYSVQLDSKSLSEALKGLNPYIQQATKLERLGEIHLISKDGKFKVFIEIPKLLKSEEYVNVIKPSPIDFDVMVEAKDLSKFVNSVIGNVELNFHMKRMGMIVRDLKNINVTFLEMLLESS